MTRRLTLLLAALCWASLAHAQIVLPGGGSSGGGGGAVSSVSTTCPPSGPSTGAVTLANSLPPTAETSAFSVACGVGYQANVTASTVVTVPVTNGLVAFVKNLSTSTAPLVLTPASGTIDGLTTEPLWPGQMATVWSNGTNVATDLNNFLSNAGYNSGGWTGGVGATGVTGSVMGAGTINCSVFIISPPGGTFKSIGGYVTTTDTSATGFVSFALYSDVASRPGNLIDSIGPTAITAPATSNNNASGSLANTTDALAPGPVFACTATPSASLVMTGMGPPSTYLLGGVGNITQAVGGSNTGASGWQCTTGATGCGTAWTTGASFTWPANFTGATWGQRNAGAVPNLALQVN